jgi:hypothetical protein
MDPQFELKLRIILDQYQRPDDLHETSVGHLLQELAIPLHAWQFRNRPKHSLRVQFERTHEWELLVALTLFGAGLLSKSFCDEFGKQLARKLIDHLFPAGEATVKPGNDPASKPLLSGKDSCDRDKLAEALGASQMANVQRIEIIRIIEIQRDYRH